MRSDSYARNIKHYECLLFWDPFVASASVNVGQLEQQLILSLDARQIRQILIELHGMAERSFWRVNSKVRYEGLRLVCGTFHLKIHKTIHLTPGRTETMAMFLLRHGHLYFALFGAVLTVTGVLYLYAKLCFTFYALYLTRLSHCSCKCK